MKRLAWVAFFAFGTALAQVSPVEPLLPPATHAGCCSHCDGSCGMPECVAVTAPAQPVCDLEISTPVVRLAAKAATPIIRVDREKFYARFLPRISVAPARPVMLALAPPAGVPLFQEHCSLLI